MKLSLIFIGACLLWLAYMQPHKCPFEHCPFKGQIEFTNVCLCPEFSDCNLLDKLHFDYPDKNYDELDSMLFETTPTRDYQLELTQDSVYIYDNRRLVGTLPYTKTGTMDSIFLIDNQ